MLRTLSLWKILPLCLLAHGTVLAQQAPAGQAPAQQTPSQPRMEVIEEGDDKPITITPPKKGGAKITEKKVDGGQVTEVTVQSGKSTYTMRPNTPAGNAQPGDGQSSATRPPQWTVLEFDLGKKKKKTDRDENAEETDATSLPPAPPPPPPAPAKK